MSTSNKMAFIFFAISCFIIPSIAYNHGKVPKETKMTLYFHDFFQGPNATSIIYSGIPGKAWTYDSFGTTLVSDDAITEGPHKNSPQIARGQGIYITASLDGVNILALISIVFTNKEYSGSSLEIHGRLVQAELKLGEVSVVGGTGKFRFANGFAIFERIISQVTPTQFYSVYRVNVTILHYDTTTLAAE